MPAKLVVTTTPKGSRIALIGTSGKELLSSAVFAEPRAKGATLRALRGLLGEDIRVEDNTTVPARKAPVAEAPAKAVRATRKTVRKPAGSKTAPAKRGGRRVAKA